MSLISINPAQLSKPYQFLSREDFRELRLGDLKYNSGKPVTFEEGLALKRVDVIIEEESTNKRIKKTVYFINDNVAVSEDVRRHFFPSLALERLDTVPKTPLQNLPLEKDGSIPLDERGKLPFAFPSPIYPFNSKKVEQ